MNKYTSFIFLLIFSSTPLVFAESHTRKHIIAGAELASLFNKSGYVDPDGNIDRGGYYDLIEKILESTELHKHYKIDVFPMNRAKNGFLKKKYACYSPGFDTFNDHNKDVLKELSVLSSQAINKVVVRVVSKKEELVASSMQDISKKDSVSIVRGTPINDQIAEILDKVDHVIMVNTEFENVKMLAYDRVTKIITYYPDVIDAYRKLNMTQHFPYKNSFTPMIINDNIVCHKQHHEAFKIIESELAKLKKSGEIKEILGDIYLIGSKYLKLN